MSLLGWILKLERDAFSAHSLIGFSSSLQEFVKDAGSYSKKMVDDLLDQITGGDHSRMIFQLKQVGFEVDILLWAQTLGPTLAATPVQRAVQPTRFQGGRLLRSLLAVFLFIKL